MRSLRDMGNPYQHAPEVSIVRSNTCKAQPAGSGSLHRFSNYLQCEMIVVPVLSPTCTQNVWPSFGGNGSYVTTHSALVNTRSKRTVGFL